MLSAHQFVSGPTSIRDPTSKRLTLAIHISIQDFLGLTASNGWNKISVHSLNAMNSTRSVPGLVSYPRWVSIFRSIPTRPLFPRVDSKTLPRWKHTTPTDAMDPRLITENHAQFHETSSSMEEIWRASLLYFGNPTLYSKTQFSFKCGWVLLRLVFLCCGRKIRGRARQKKYELLWCISVSGLRPPCGLATALVSFFIFIMFVAHPTCWNCYWCALWTKTSGE